MRRLLVVGALAAASLARPAFAGSCEITVTRTACKGQEKESFSKCDGKASCSKTVEAASADACVAKAAEECPNSRLTVTKSKVVKAVFDGKEVKDNACDPGRPDFNKCD